MTLAWKLCEGAFMAACLALAYCDAVEVFVAWYSGMAPEASPTRLWALGVRCVLLLLAAAATGWLLWTARD
jgi:hypothetical protein